MESATDPAARMSALSRRERQVLRLSGEGKSTEAVGQEFSSPSEGALSRRSLVIGSLIAGLALGAASLLYASPFIFFGGDSG